MFKTLFALLLIALGNNLFPSCSQSSSASSETVSPELTLEDFWLKEKLHDWKTAEERLALVWALKQYMSKGYSHISASVSEAIKHLQAKPRAEILAAFKRDGTQATTQASAILNLTEADAQKILAQKVASCYPHCSSERQTEHVASIMTRVKRNKSANLAWETERAVQKIESEFEKRQKKLAQGVQEKYPDISPAHQEALTHFLASQALDISTTSDASALLERALLDPKIHSEYRKATTDQLRSTAAQLTETREQRDASQQQAAVLRELLRQAQEAQAAAEHRSTTEVERESSSTQGMLQELVAKEAAAVHEKEALAAPK
jgi:hypothetical protein